MGMDPKMYVSASFYAGALTDEENDALELELDSLGFLVAHEEDDYGVVGHYSKGFVVVFEFLTHYWGDSLDEEGFKEASDGFVNRITEFCTNKEKCKLPSFRWSATYW